MTLASTLPAGRPRRAVLAPLAVALLSAALMLTACSGGGDPGAQTAATPSGEGASSEPSEQSASEEPGPSGDAEPGSAEPGSTEATDAAQDAGAGAAVGEVVEGFPIDLVAVYPGAEVALTSAVPSGGGLDVTLAGRSGDAPDTIVGFYRQRLVAAGFAEAAGGPGSAGAVSATFTRGGGAEVLSVAVVSTSGVPPQQFTVGGTIAPTP